MVKIVEVTEKNLPFDLAADVKTHMVNDKDFYRKEYYPCMANIQSKIKSKDFNPIPLMQGMITKGCNQYSKKYDIPQDQFDNEFIRNLITDVMRDELPRMRKGEY